MKLNQKNADGKTVLLGLGLDNRDGHQRITTGDDYCLLGGSEQTHEQMAEVAAKVHEKLTKKGKTMSEVSPEELADLIQESKN